MENLVQRENDDDVFRVLEHPVMAGEHDGLQRVLQPQRRWRKNALQVTVKEYEDQNPFHEHCID